MATHGHEQIVEFDGRQMLESWLEAKVYGWRVHIRYWKKRQLRHAEGSGRDRGCDREAAPPLVLVDKHGLQIRVSRFWLGDGEQ
jgi:hypothetical protein